MLNDFNRDTTVFSQNLHQIENKHHIMNVHTKWNCLIPILSSVTCFRSENAISFKRPLHVSGKITTVPRLFSQNVPQMENSRL